MSDSVRPHRQQPTRLRCPWDSPGKNTGVGCHFLLQCMKVKSESEVARSCPTLQDPMDCSLPGSSVHGIFQARVLEWVAIAFSFTFSRITQMFVPKKAVQLDYKSTLLLLQMLRWLSGVTTKVYKSQYVCIWVKKNNVFPKLWGLCLYFCYQNLVHSSVHEC